MQSWWVAIFVLIMVTTFAKGDNYQGINNALENSEDAETEIDYRLPTSVMPMAYDITLLLPGKGNFTSFDGTVIIEAFVDEPTNEVVLHVGKITLLSYKINTPSAPWVQPYKTEYDPVTEKYKILMNSTLSSNQNITIAIKYHGDFRDDMIGLYQSSYFDKNGATKYVETQFLLQFHKCNEGIPECLMIQESKCYTDGWLPHNSNQSMRDTFFPVSMSPASKQLLHSEF